MIDLCVVVWVTSPPYGQAHRIDRSTPASVQVATVDASVHLFVDFPYFPHPVLFEERLYRGVAGAAAPSAATGAAAAAVTATQTGDSLPPVGSAFVKSARAAAAAVHGRNAGV